jgi:hypothetical protein
MSHARALLLSTIVAMAAGCSSPPANVAGSYSVSLTNGNNGCMFSTLDGSPWVGQMTTGVALEITQSGTAITATVGGVAAGYFDAIFGGHVFLGNVSGTHMDLVIHGTRMDACGATLDAHATVDLVGDALVNGTITYSYAHVTATCPAYEATCTSDAAFNGSRPPSR